MKCELLDKSWITWHSIDWLPWAEVWSAEINNGAHKPLFTCIWHESTISNGCFMPNVVKGV